MFLFDVVVVVVVAVSYNDDAAVEFDLAFVLLLNETRKKSIVKFIASNFSSKVTPEFVAAVVTGIPSQKVIEPPSK